MANVFLYSGATGANNGTSWEDAYTTLSNAINAAGDGGIIYVADEHVQSGASISFSGTAGILGDKPQVLISCDLLTGTTVSYKKATTSQFIATSTTLTITNSFLLVGIRLSVATSLILNAGSGEAISFSDCDIVLDGAASTIAVATNQGYYSFSNCNIVVEEYASSTPLFTLSTVALTEVEYCVFSGTGLDNRTGSIFTQSGIGSQVRITGCDFSGFTAASSIINDTVASTATLFEFFGCNKPSAVPISTTGEDIDKRYPRSSMSMGNNDYNFDFQGALGKVVGSATYRNGGASINGTGFSWSFSSNANCFLGDSVRSPWIVLPPSYLGTAGSKTITVYIGSSISGLTNADIWVDVEYFSSNTVVPIIASTRAGFGEAGSALTVDSLSTWSPAQTYQYKIPITITTGKVGSARVRIVLAKASVSDGTLNIDPRAVIT